MLQKMTSRAGNAIINRIDSVCCVLDRTSSASSCSGQSISNPIRKLYCWRRSYGLGTKLRLFSSCSELLKISNEQALNHFANITTLHCVVPMHQQAQELIPIRRVGCFGSRLHFKLVALHKVLSLESNERMQSQQRESICLIATSMAYLARTVRCLPLSNCTTKRR